MKKIVFLLLFSISSIALLAQVKLEAKAPQFVKVGERFKVVFSLNSKPEAVIEMPRTEDFQILYGPSRSSSSSIQIINGQTTSTSSYTYSYVLLAEQEGTFTIPAATTVVGGNSISSNSLTIEVLPADSQTTPAPQGGNSNQYNQGQGQNQATTPSQNSAKNFFARVQVSKSSLYRDEHLIVTTKLYTRYGGISNLQILQAPSFNGFLSHEIPNSSDNAFRQENIDGVIYNTAVLRKYVLFPQKSGELTIDPMEVVANAQERVTSGHSIFDQFFGGQVQTREVHTKTSPIKINVKPLPGGRPAGFSSGVGNFQINASLDKDSVASNEAITLKVQVKGNGNLKVISPPKFEFDPSLEVYDPKVDQNTGISTTGMSGSITYEYLIIPRRAGNYTIPATTFSYFDPKSGTYKEQRIPEFRFGVSKSEGEEDYAPAGSQYSNVQQQDVQVFGNDIQFIKTTPLQTRAKNNFFFGSSLYWLLFGGLLLLFALGCMLSRKRNLSQNDLVKVKSKRATKIAIKRLKIANKSLKAQDSKLFYPQVLDALWGFASDKLSISLSELNKDNITELLIAKEVPQEDIERYVKVLNQCEFAQYAPSSAGNQMSEVYKEAIDAISNIENQL